MDWVDALISLISGVIGAGGGYAQRSSADRNTITRLNKSNKEKNIEIRDLRSKIALIKESVIIHTGKRNAYINSLSKSLREQKTQGGDSFSKKYNDYRTAFSQTNIPSVYADLLKKSMPRENKLELAFQECKDISIKMDTIVNFYEQMQGFTAPKK